MNLHGQNLNAATLKHLRRWFGDYIHSFLSGSADADENIILKADHTERVCRESVLIGNSLGLEPQELLFAEILALFHDVGRFEQYRRFNTFADRDSVNHAELGVKILRREKTLDRLAYSDRELALKAIGCHNRAVLPEDEDPAFRLFARLLRDADKLDIWKVVTDYYGHQASGSNRAIELDLPDTPGISDGVCGDLMAGHIVYSHHLENLNDFKMLQMGWVFDLNFRPSFCRLAEMGYLGMIRSVLPDDERVDAVYRRIDTYLRSMVVAGAAGAEDRV